MPLSPLGGDTPDQVWLCVATTAPGCCYSSRSADPNDLHLNYATRFCRGLETYTDLSLHCRF